MSEYEYKSVIIPIVPAGQRSRVLDNVLVEVNVDHTRSVVCLPHALDKSVLLALKEEVTLTYDEAFNRFKLQCFSDPSQYQAFIEPMHAAQKSLEVMRRRLVELEDHHEGQSDRWAAFVLQQITLMLKLVAHHQYGKSLCDALDQATTA